MKHIKLFEGFPDSSTSNSDWFTLEPTEKFYNTILDNPSQRWSLTDIDKINVQAGGKPQQITRKDQHMSQWNGKGEWDEDSFFYFIRLSRNNKGELIWDMFSQLPHEQLNERPIGVGKFYSEDIGSLDDRKLFEIIGKR